MGRGWQISSPVSGCQVPGRNFPVPGIDGGAVQVPPGEKKGSTRHGAERGLSASRFLEVRGAVPRGLGSFLHGAILSWSKP